MIFCAMSCHAVPCRAVLYYAMPCRDILCHAVPCCAVPCGAILCHAVPCHAVPCRACSVTHGKAAELHTEILLGCAPAFNSNDGCPRRCRVGKPELEEHLKRHLWRQLEKQREVLGLGRAQSSRGSSWLAGDTEKRCNPELSFLPWVQG